MSFDEPPNPVADVILILAVVLMIAVATIALGAGCWLAWAVFWNVLGVL